jgi:hypothetical protein
MTYDKVCKNCAYWKPYHEEYYRSEFGKCSSKVFEYGENGAFDSDEKETNAKFLYWDGSGWIADFATHEAFGCVGFTYIHEIEQVEEM